MRILSTIILLGCSFVLSAQLATPYVICNVPLINYQAEFADLNGDDLVDLVYGSQHGVYWSENLGNGEFVPAELIELGGDNWPLGLAVLDINLDGLNDLISSRFSSYNDPELPLVAFYNEGNMVFTEQMIHPSAYYYDVKSFIAKINTDSYSDLFVLHEASLEIMLNDAGNGFMTSGSIEFPENNYPRIADINSDGLKDIVFINSLENQLSYCKNNGDGTFSNRTKEANLTGIFSGLNTLHADYDNDGDQDVLILRGLWLTGGTHPNSLLQNNCKGIF